MKKILVTGCAGFIGSNLCKNLIEKGFNVIGIDNLMAGTLENVPENVGFHKVDIRAEEIYPLFRDTDTVFHLAARNCLSDCMEHPVDTCDVNITGTMNVLEAARLAGVRKFVYADSSAEYEGIDVFPSPVEITKPIGVYANSKKGGALMCGSYRALYGMNITTLRYFNVYGPAQDFRRVMPPVMSAFVLKLLEGKNPVIYGSGEKRRDFVYVDDINRFHIQCIEDPRTDGGTYNLGSGVNYSINEIYRLIETQMQTGIKVEYQDEKPGEAEVTLADISKTVEIGWNPETDIEEGIRLSIEYLRGKYEQGVRL